MIGSAAEVARAIQARQSFMLTSHARPDGDAVGSQLALAFALDALGKTVRLVNHDPPPAPYRVFPGVDRLTPGARALGPADAVIVLECGDLTRPEVEGLGAYFVINVDHHPGNTMYGAVNWYDDSAAACTELVAELIDALGVAWTPAIATHLYLGIITDTGGFRHANITTRTFEICRRSVAAGIDPALMARQIFDSYGIGRVRITGALLNAMELAHDGQLALLYLDDELLTRCGATLDDTDSLVNVPLGAKDVCAVALFKRQSLETFRVSLRSKGGVDVRSVAAAWGGGGHKNAAGCTISAPLDLARSQVVAALGGAIDDASRLPIED